jgi:DNA-binding NarL/FixJ family response regulator
MLGNLQNTAKQVNSSASPEVSQAFQAKAQPKALARARSKSFLSFSPREKAIIDSICEGLTNGQIAAKLGIEFQKIVTIINELIQTFECKNREELLINLTKANVLLDLPSLTPADVNLSENFFWGCTR